MEESLPGGDCYRGSGHVAGPEEREGDQETASCCLGYRFSSVDLYVEVLAVGAGRALSGCSFQSGASGSGWGGGILQALGWFYHCSCGDHR